MKQDYQHTFLEFLIAENKELKAFIKSVVEKSLKIDKPVITSGYRAPIGITGAATLNSEALNQYSNIQTGFGPSFSTAQAVNPIFGMKEAIGKSAIDIAKERIEKIPAETPEEKEEKKQALKEMNNIFGLD